MERKTEKQISLVFEKYPKIKLAYIFGSRARGDFGPLSDFDFAFYTTEKDKKKIFDTRLKLMTDLSLLLKSDNVDVVALNTIENSELKYNIINEGKLLLEKEPHKILVETRIMNEYFDFQMSLALNSVKAG